MSARGGALKGFERGGIAGGVRYPGIPAPPNPSRARPPSCPKTDPRSPAQCGALFRAEPLLKREPPLLKFELPLWSMFELLSTMGCSGWRAGSADGRGSGVLPRKEGGVERPPLDIDGGIAGRGDDIGCAGSKGTAPGGGRSPLPRSGSCGKPPVISEDDEPIVGNGGKPPENSEEGVTIFGRGGKLPASDAAGKGGIPRSPESGPLGRFGISGIGGGEVSWMRLSTGGENDVGIVGGAETWLLKSGLFELKSSFKSKRIFLLMILVLAETGALLRAWNIALAAASSSSSSSRFSDF